MSVSSLEGSPVPLDLPAKYQKLAAEYAKIRAQLGVLKKAVVDEQNLTAELKETLKIKDQNMRKAEQELDSLNFRNQQLTKRVTMLQDELDSLQNTSKGNSKSKGTIKETKNTVIMEELQKKIAENANLISTLQEQTEKYENEKFKLNQKIEIHEHKIKEYQMNLSLIEGTKLAKYENENKLLLSKLNTKDEEIKKLNNEIRKLKCDLGGRSSALNNISFKENFSKLIQSLTLQELFTLLSQFFQQLEFRYSKNMENKHFQKFLEINQKNRLFLQDFVDKYLLYCNKGVEVDLLLGIENLCKNIQNYVLVLEDLSECLEFSKDEEILVIKEITFNFKKHWTEFNSALIKSQTPDLTTADYEDIISKLTDVFRSFRGTCDYFLSALNEKFKSNSSNKESEKEILGLLSKMSLQSSYIYKKLTEGNSILMQVLEYCLVKIKQKNALSQSNQCCEHWKQEFEQLKAAHVKKIKDLEEQISCLSEATTPHSTHSGNLAQSSFEEKKETEDQYNDCEANSSDLPVIGEEAEIIKFYNTRANKLVADRQYAESRVTVLKEECENLQKRLELSLESRLLLEDSIKQTQNTVNRLQEELQTTTLNYEMQLQSMSEHMANMNEKFASQEEEIEILKHKLTGKFQDSKKGKSSMH